MSFPNLSDKGPLKAVKFCSLDTMFHIMLRSSPYVEDQDFRRIAARLRQAVQNHNGSRPLIEADIRPALENDNECFMSVWHPGDIDLEDMVCILESIPELDAQWLRKEVDALKHEACLTAEDLPFLNCYRPEDCEYYKTDEDCFLQDAWYSSGWLSAKGGTLYFRPDTPNRIMDRVSSCLAQTGATVSPVIKGESVWEESQCQTLRFQWSCACKSDELTAAAVFSALEEIPGVLRDMRISQP